MDVGGGGEEMWSSSQESLGDWPTDEMELEHLQALSRCSTDDDKISEWTICVLSILLQYHVAIHMMRNCEVEVCQDFATVEWEFH